MDTIFHERQEGSLCAQHCLNVLLQGSYFSAVDLADIGRQLDETERDTMAEAGVNTDEFRSFLNQESTNYDDSGFFSIQVLQQALRVWDLELLPYSSSTEVAQQARTDPRTQTAYICNFREHWFCIRKLGQQWFNLNSLLKRPDLVSDTYLHMYLQQLQQEGYSIFIVRGNLPQCEADEILQLVRVEAQPAAYQSSSTSISTTDLDPDVQVALMESRKLAESGDSQKVLKAALAQSRREAGLGEEDDEDGDIARAIQLSLEAESATGSTASSAASSSQPGTSAAAAASTHNAAAPDPEEIRRLRLQFLEKKSAVSAAAAAASSAAADTKSAPADKNAKRT